MFRRVLIANRGEVAVRVLKTCKRLGITAVAAYTDDERDLSWLEDADETVCIGPVRSYLDQDALLQAARQTGCSALHPGWGFLSENATFAARCEAIGVRFIGPPAHLIRSMGDKIEARRSMKALGLDPIPGTDEPISGVEVARSLAKSIGYPVLLKAASGGGGRGMRRVYAEAELAEAFAEASSEALASFGDGRLYMEKLIEAGRHIEFQVLGDCTGRVLVLGERECSIQRRHQKLLEESPSPVLSPQQREEVSQKIAAALSAAGYMSAGTVEMLRDPSGELYFMELNTRLQVEHRVTEMTTGIDLVEWQLRVAATQRLPETWRAARGHAIELRINAEDPDRNFLPTPGRLERFSFPVGEGIRVETHLRAGDSVSPHYDSMIAKLVVHGDSREDAIKALETAIAGCEIVGVHTTLGLHSEILAHSGFRAGDYDTQTLAKMQEA
ncbi:MAG: biotin carboxylase N-terminal domain-containing protein [Myxococcota bacterium]|nr:biotin carboxylase N-terminal domain-containing protein [Myxococcota bacterium]